VNIEHRILTENRPPFYRMQILGTSGVPSPSIRKWTFTISKAFEGCMAEGPETQFRSFFN